MTFADRPVITLKPRESGRLKRGHPWVYSNEIAMDVAAKAILPGALVTLADANGVRLAAATFNRNSLIAARILSLDPEAAIDAAFIAARLEAAAALRARFFAEPFYRLIHSEADGLPGLIVDRFGDAFVVQANTAGMETLTPLVIEALASTLGASTIVLKNDSPMRAVEGLGQSVATAHGALAGSIAVPEEGVAFAADLAGGQKTGWFFDQRPARSLIASLAKGVRVLDLFSHTGGFALRAAHSGAAEVVAVESSEPALTLARTAAGRSGLEARTRFIKSDVFADIGVRAAKGERFDIVVADPPAFVKSRKGLAAGLKGYRKLARMMAPLVAPGGLMLAASCSHLVDPPSFAAEIHHGLAAAHRTGRVLASGGAGPDHPIHPQLPESAYLKWELLQLD